MSNYDAYEQKMQAQLARWRAEIDLLKAKASHASEDAKMEFDRRMGNWQASHVLAKAKLDELRAASGAAREALHKEVEKAFRSVSEGRKSAVAKFRK
jgi:asparagine synthetase B (glutamine-hydrolysing)